MNRGLQKLENFERKGLGGKKTRDILFPSITSYWARHKWEYYKNSAVYI